MKKTNGLIALFLVFCLTISIFDIKPSADGVIDVGKERISNDERRAYVNDVIAYHLSSKGEKIVSDSLKNGKSVVFFFEGASNNVLYESGYSNYNQYRFASVCIVIQLVDGNPKIVYFDDFCSTLPDHPRGAYGLNEEIATLVDGVYPLINCNHYTFAALHVPAYDWGTSIWCSKNGYYVDACYGINIHSRGTDIVTSDSGNSRGCLLVGKNPNVSGEYNDFMYAVTGIEHARTNAFDEVALDYGCVIIDRALYKNELLKIYDAGRRDEKTVVGIITAYTDKLNAAAKRKVPAGETPREVHGDINADGKINTADAVYLLRSIMRPDKYPVKQNCDMDGNGVVNVADAISLLRTVLRASSR